MTCDFQQCGILTIVGSDEPLQPPFKLRNSKWCSFSLTIIKYSSDQQRLCSDCSYAQADLRLCWSHIPHCWKSHALAQIPKFLNVLNVWDVRLEISVVSTHVNLNGLNVHGNNWKMENRPVHWFRLTHLNKSMEKMWGSKYSKHRQNLKFCHSHLNSQYFNYCMRRSFFGLVYMFGLHERLLTYP